MGQALRDGYRAARLPDDQDRRPHAQGRPPRRSSSACAALADRRHRSDADPRGDPRRRPGARASAPGGAIEALLAAQKAGKIRFIGFTGHKGPAIHLTMLEAAAAHGFTLRHRADAAQRDGRALRQLRAAGAAGARRRRGIGVLGDEAARLGPVPAQRAAREAAGVARRSACATRWACRRRSSSPAASRCAILEQALDAAYGCRPMTRRGSQGAARPHRPRRRQGRVGEVQDLRHVRRHGPQPALARDREALSGGAKSIRCFRA